MPEEKQVADAPQANEEAARPAKRRRRMSAPLVVAALIMFLAMASYFANGVSLLLELDVFTRGLGNASVAAGALTPEGQRLVLGGVYLFFGALALIFLIGFLLRRRWAWVATMTWTALSLIVGLVAYFSGQPKYLSMLAGVVLLLVLNQTSVHQEFQVEAR